MTTSVIAIIVTLIVAVAAAAVGETVVTRKIIFFSFLQLVKTLHFAYALRTLTVKKNQFLRFREVIFL